MTCQRNTVPQQVRPHCASAATLLQRLKGLLKAPRHQLLEAITLEMPVSERPRHCQHIAHTPVRHPATGRFYPSRLSLHCCAIAVQPALSRMPDRYKRQDAPLNVTGFGIISKRCFSLLHCVQHNFAKDSAHLCSVERSTACPRLLRTARLSPTFATTILSLLTSTTVAVEPDIWSSALGSSAAEH